MDEHRNCVIKERKFLNKERHGCNEDPNNFYMEIHNIDQG